jgi:trehalose/maltose transport system substrate-binding protein
VSAERTEKVRKGAVLVAGGLTSALALVVLLTVVAAGSAGTDAVTQANVKPPKVANAAAIKARYGGRSITFIGDNIGLTHKRDLALAKRFSQDTGIKVKVIPHPAASTDSYAQLARLFSSKSSSVDVMMLDVVWPGAFAPFLVNLKPALSKEAKVHSQGIIKGATFDGKLVAMPYFGDYGILYYRTDLLGSTATASRRPRGSSSERWRRRSRTARAARTPTSQASCIRATRTKA